MGTLAAAFREVQTSLSGSMPTGDVTVRDHSRCILREVQVGEQEADDLSRALDMLRTPWLLRILYGLGHQLTPSQSATGADSIQINHAVERLVEIGAVRYTTPEAPPAGVEQVTLTAKGRRMIHALTDPVDLPPRPQAPGLQ